MSKCIWHVLLGQPVVFSCEIDVIFLVLIFVLVNLSCEIYFIFVLNELTGVLWQEYFLNPN